MAASCSAALIAPPVTSRRPPEITQARRILQTRHRRLEHNHHRYQADARRPGKPGTNAGKGNGKFRWRAASGAQNAARQRHHVMCAGSYLCAGAARTGRAQVGKFRARTGPRTRPRTSAQGTRCPALCAQCQRCAQGIIDSADSGPSPARHLRQSSGWPVVRLSRFGGPLLPVAIPLGVVVFEVFDEHRRKHSASQAACVVSPGRVPARAGSSSAASALGTTSSTLVRACARTGVPAKQSRPQRHSAASDFDDI